MIYDQLFLRPQLLPQREHCLSNKNSFVGYSKYVTEKTACLKHEN